MLLSRKPRFITSDSQNSPIFDAARVDGWTGSDLWFGDAMEVRISYSTIQPRRKCRTVKSREIHYLHQLLISGFSVKSPQEGLVLS